MRFMFTYCLEMSTTTVMEWRESGTLSRLCQNCGQQNNLVA